nr:Plug domain-containing protein [Bradyrhizobium sp.]
MFRRRALGSASALALCGALSAIPAMVKAQTADQPLPPVTIEAPNQRQAVRAAKKPARRTAAAARRKKPAATAATKPPVPAAAGAGVTPSAADDPLATPPIKQRFQLPQESYSITAKQIEETINLKDPEDALKYLPSLFVRKRNDGDNQAVLATRTWGLSSSARTLIYYDDLLISALIGNNNSGASPHWNLVSPEAIARIDFL